MKNTYSIDLLDASPGSAETIEWEDIDDPHKQIILVDPSKWVNPTFYLEAILLNTATSIRLFNITDGVPVTGSTFTGTTALRDRSSAFSLPSGPKEYKIQTKATQVNIYKPVQVRLIIIDSFEASTFTKLEYQIDIGDVFSTDSKDPIETSSPYYFLHETTPYDGALTIYFEATLYSSKAGKSSYVELWDKTSGIQITYVETTSATPVRIRSKAIILTSGHEYVIRVWGSLTTAYVTGTKIIIVQTGNPITKTRNHFRMGYPHIRERDICDCTKIGSLLGYFLIVFSELLPTRKAFYYEATMRHVDANSYAIVEMCRGTTCVGYQPISVLGTAYKRDRGEVTGYIQDSKEYTGSLLSSYEGLDAYLSYLFLIADLTTEVPVPIGFQYSDGLVTILTGGK